MKLRLLSVAVAAFLAACTADARVTPDVRSPMYQRGDGGETVECQGLPLRTMCGSEKSPSLIYYDCSDEQFDCVFDTHDVLSVPKAGLTLGQTYSIFGATLHVKRCYGPNGYCDVALITSKCAPKAVCDCRFNDSAPPTFAFVYSREKGITAFYTLKDQKELADLGVDSEMLTDTLPLLTFVLAAEHGFLKARLALPTAELRTTCLAESTSRG